MQTLNILGAGHAGRTLAALWHEHSVFVIHDILNRSSESAEAATRFIGAGHACSSMHDMHPADLWLMATPDDELVHAARALADSGLLRSGDVVFQLSGATPSSEIIAILNAGVNTGATTGVLAASVHPLKSFADAGEARRTFAGTYCAVEGSVAALALLRPAFECIGGRVTTIDPQHKVLYHAASVMVCHGLTALMETGLQCYEKAGLPRATASVMMEPLVRETLDHVLTRGTVQALTGPIARGDQSVVARQLAALQAFDPRIAQAYRALGLVALELSGQQGRVDAATRDATADLLRDS